MRIALLNVSLFAIFLTGVSVGEVAQLIKDSNFRMAPQMKDGPDVENHGGAWVWHVPAGKSSIPNWECSGQLHLWQMKNNNRRIVDFLGGKGTISQTVATQPGKWYTVYLRTSARGEGGKNQTFIANCAGQVTRVAQADLGNRTIKFQAKGPSTTLLFTGTAVGGFGPLLYQAQCAEFDPEADKIELALKTGYVEMDRGEKNEKDIPKLLSYLTEDFSYKPAEGPVLDRAGFEELVRQRLEKKYKVNSAIQEVTRNGDGSVTVEVERRQQEPGEYGKLNSSAPHFKHTWIKVGSVWKLKSSEELAAEQ